jgi:lactate permease
MAFFKMSGDKSSIISLIVTMLIALFGFAFSVDNQRNDTTFIT